MNSIFTAPASDPLHTKPGKPYPLGATYDGEGVNFALFSANATAVYLCLFNTEQPGQEIARIELTEQTEQVWHIYIEDMQPGQLYGYRVDGPYAPQEGHYFNPQKLLLDPYARAIAGPVIYDDSLLGYNPTLPEDKRFTESNSEDSGPKAPKSVIIDSSFDWEDDTAPATPMSRTVFYEMHVKGFTWQQPSIPKKLRGTYSALAHTEATDYLKKLGVTAVELMPIHQFLNESYWGYNTIGFFAPHNGYAIPHAAATDVVTEFKEMVKALHKAGIEVILDVVYNHTGEGNHYGPTLSLQGIDNRAYYRQVAEQPEYYMDYTGTGNTLDLTSPRALQLVMDSLRYWVTEMHIDGFRFDLAATLIRSAEQDGHASSFLDTISQDPVLAQVKLIAEPWDIGSYQVGNFPVRWSEWNGRYRDCVRMYWKGDEAKAHELSCRVLGSPDLYADGRQPANSVNMITAHDGFTLNDLVSYNDKHNEANGEDNNDGANDNHSWNMGAEGPTDNEGISAMRERQKRNFLATMFLSQGTPMLLMGDEYGRTQQGNNNVYNQDNELSWMNWRWTENQQALFTFTSQLTALRQQYPMLRRRKFYTHDELTWLHPDGHPLTEADWHNPNTRCLALLLDSTKVDEQDENGNPIASQDGEPSYFLWILNSYWEDIHFRLPDLTGSWQLLVDSNEGVVKLKGKKLPKRKKITIIGRSTLLLGLTA